jgi:hypothetical protein
MGDLTGNWSVDSVIIPRCKVNGGLRALGEPCVVGQTLKEFGDLVGPTFDLLDLPGLDFSCANDPPINRGTKFLRVALNRTGIFFQGSAKESSKAGIVPKGCGAFLKIDPVSPGKGTEEGAP